MSQSVSGTQQVDAGDLLDCRLAKSPNVVTRWNPSRSVRRSVRLGGPCFFAVGVFTVMIPLVRILCKGPLCWSCDSARKQPGQAAPLLFNRRLLLLSFLCSSANSSEANGILNAWDGMPQEIDLPGKTIELLPASHGSARSWF